MFWTTKISLKEKRFAGFMRRHTDYSLRTTIVFKEIENGQYFIDTLTKKGQWIFRVLKVRKNTQNYF